MPFRRSPITRRQFRDYNHATQTLNDMDIEMRLRTAGSSFGGVEAVLARRLMADVARLVSREPGNRALLRLPATGDITRETMREALNDARIALTAFMQAHSLDDDPEVPWIEGMKQDFAEDF